MPSTALFFCAFALSAAFIVSLVLTGGVRYAARRIGFVDRPDGGRKTQKEAVALGGGIAVALSVAVVLTIAAIGSWLIGGRLLEDLIHPSRLVLAAGAALILALGLIDDAIALRGRYKLLGQVLIAGMLVAAGLRINALPFFGQPINLQWFAIPFTLFWLLGAINAINLIDGIDGLAGSVGVVLCLTIAAISFLQGNFPNVVIMLSLSGALIGFLRYNFAPASIYLGDAGSMLVGLVVGAVSIPVSAKSALAIGMTAPLAILSIPILDSVAAIVRRKLTGRSLFAADRGHLHHSLLQRGWTVRQTSTFIALICATTCVSAVLSVRWRNDAIALLTVLAVVLYLVYTRTFGHIEFALVTNRFSTVPSTRGADTADVTGRHRSIQLQGSREWDKLWAAIVESADDHRLSRVKFSINMPALDEVYFAKWDSTKHAGEDEDLWKVEHPLIVDGERVGALELTGLPADDRRSTPSQIAKALEFLEPIEEDIYRIREHIRVERQEVKVGGSPSATPPSGSAEAVPGGRVASSS